MWLQLPSPTTTIGLDNLGSVESDALERVHGYQDNATIGIDAMLGITIADRMKD